MFTGIIAHLGRITTLEKDPRDGARLTLEAPTAISEGIAAKDSIAIDGVCLTVVSSTSRLMTFDVVPETLARSTLGALRIGDTVNVELALRAGDRLGGHLVYGHVDATAPILGKVAEGQGHRLSLGLPDDLRDYIVTKGFIAVDGVSLTIAATTAGGFEIALIPETAARTGLGRKDRGDRVNLEIDPIARYAVGAAERYGVGTAGSREELAWAYEI
jgi:riboflavin synthase